MTLSLLGKIRPCAVSSSGPRVLVVASRSSFPSVLIVQQEGEAACVRMMEQEGASGAGSGGGSVPAQLGVARWWKSCGGGIERRRCRVSGSVWGDLLPRIKRGGSRRGRFGWAGH